MAWIDSQKSLLFIVLCDFGAKLQLLSELCKIPKRRGNRFLAAEKLAKGQFFDYHFDYHFDYQMSVKSVARPLASFR